jgi:hypothetical protein
MGESVRTVQVVERDGDVVRIIGDGPKGSIEVIASMRRQGDELVLRELHADGTGPGSLGIGEVRAFARELGRQEGVRVVEIHGGTRTTGARPGKLPRPVRILVEELPHEPRNTGGTDPGSE